VLGAVFGSSLLFPRDFVGRGDMSRGGLLLRAAKAVSSSLSTGRGARSGAAAGREAARAGSAREREV
jgi:hypothetical protein